MIRVLQGDCIEMLATLPADSVHCVVTSPPYYGLRDYQTAQWDGGDAGCSHFQASRRMGSATTLRSDGREHTGPYDGEKALITPMPYRDTCGKCGAIRIDRQIGLEATPDEYLTTMVAVFREVRRVLRDDGTCWVNIGDSYASNGPSSWGSSDKSTLTTGSRNGAWAPGNTIGNIPARSSGNAKPKDLLMMPARLALALQVDGWWIRSDIIWHKPNPMPESCTDRPTSSHEHVFLLTKSGATTFWTHRDHSGSRTSPEPDYRWVHAETKHEVADMPADWDTHEPTRKLWCRINLWRGHDYFYDADAVREDVTGNAHPRGDGLTPKSATPGQGVKSNTSFHAAVNDLVSTRNLRNVWMIATAPYSDAHFATFPPALAERCIRAGTSERGCCAACGAPWVRQTDTAYSRNRTGKTGRVDVTGSNGWDDRTYPNLSKHVITAGWAPSCTCDAPAAPCTILDPFAGAFTAPMVADRLQRHAIGIELSAAYCDMARERITKDAGMFADVVA